MRLTLQQRKLLEWFIFVVFFFLYALLLVVVVVGIFILLLGQSLPALQQLGWQKFFTDALWNPTAYGEPQYGMGPMLASSGLVTGGAVALAIPIGVGCAAYLAEVARPWERQLLKPAIEILAGLPSVAVGFIGLAVLEPFIARIFGLSHGLNALNGVLLVAIMVLPTVISVSDDALQAVPSGIKEASLTLGASRWQTLTHISLPAAFSGITASIMLGVGRAIGETMTVLMATGNALAMPHSFLDPVRTMTAAIAIELGEVPYNSLHYQALFVVGLVLFIFSLLINLASDIMLERYRRKFGS